uniref:Putative nuclease harbi1-like protein n=1 Tax=Triatoma infestans TaxID=30076 RepID=A0A023F1D4_TRIIF
MSPRNKIAAAAIIIIRNKKKREEKRSVWVRKWVLQREEKGLFTNLLKELQKEDDKSYKNFLRMSHEDYECLLKKVEPLVKRKDTHLRRAISASERLTLTLRFLATGDSYHSLSYLFRIPVTTIARIIPEVCGVIFKVMKADYLQTPTSEEEWYAIAKDFEEIWNFPNCIGALDGKHVVMKAPKNSGSLYFNYKGTFSIVLMALVDAKYKFFYVDAGCNGRISDGGVYANCSLSAAMENNTLNIPNPRPLPNESEPAPFVMVADDAFAMQSYLLKPFPYKNQPGFNRVFNYRLSRARRVVENAFGLISAKFRVLRKPIELPPEKVKSIVLAICALHNFLLSKPSSANLYAPLGTFDSEIAGSHIHGSWRNEGHPDATLYSLKTTYMNKNHTKTAKNIREQFQNYFVSQHGEIPWQYKNI